MIFNLEKYKNNIAFITDERSYTYEEVKRISDEIGKFISDRSLVFILCKNQVESLLCYIATIEKGCVPLLLNFDIAESALLRLIEIYQPKYIWGEETRLGQENFGVKKYCYGNFLLLENYTCISPSLNKELALLLSTSGSTGSSKCVRLTYRNIVENAKAIADFLEITEHDITITTLPMSYTYGLSIINSHLICGAAIVITDCSLLERKFWTLFSSNKVNSFGGVPFTYELLQRINFWNKDISNIRYLTSSGGRMSSELLSEIICHCEEKKIRFYLMYGQTEATARMSYLPYNMIRKKRGSIGKPIKGGLFWLEDDEGKLIETPNTDGNLYYKGVNVCWGYAESYHDLIKDDCNHGILDTGDTAFFDEDGYYYLRGRKKRILKIYGSRVNLDELEKLMDKEGYKCICTGEDDNLFIFTNDEKKVNDIDNYIKNSTSISKGGYKVAYIEKFPHSYSGKIDYEQLKQYI